ncbi:tRNA methyl transferase [Besnoitia besnoiti]|uniref:tRNA-5-taurinomethyluridine 2-sulfurtransferase n=1 Tax=Besnoitia besnoiti TaxID=94643 RepID=A0A2A9M9N2_BESBE|nr:tRNA methyl transferase [Besnoitia besnoiti]PFH33914.1 tRNA methyl transferase [Besnoitia besnoiti]
MLSLNSMADVSHLEQRGCARRTISAPAPTPFFSVSFEGAAGDRTQSCSSVPRSTAIHLEPGLPSRVGTGPRVASLSVRDEDARPRAAGAGPACVKPRRGCPIELKFVSACGRSTVPLLGGREEGRLWRRSDGAIAFLVSPVRRIASTSVRGWERLSILDRFDIGYRERRASSLRPAFPLLLSVSPSPPRPSARPSSVAFRRPSSRVWLDFGDRFPSSALAATPRSPSLVSAPPPLCPSLSNSPSPPPCTSPPPPRSLPPRLEALLSELKQPADLQAVFDKLVAFASDLPAPSPARKVAARRAAERDSLRESSPSSSPAFSSVNSAEERDSRPNATEMRHSRDEEGPRDASAEGDDPPQSWERVQGCTALVRIKATLCRPSSPGRKSCQTKGLLPQRQDPREDPPADLSLPSAASLLSSPAAASPALTGSRGGLRTEGTEDEGEPVTPLPAPRAAPADARGDAERRREGDKVYVHLRGWSDSLLVRGWLAILVRGLRNSTPEEILSLTLLDLLSAAGLKPSERSRPSGPASAEAAKAEHGGGEGEKAENRERREDRLPETRGGTRKKDAGERRREEEKRRLLVPQGLDNMLRSIQRQVRAELAGLEEEGEGDRTQANADTGEEEAGESGRVLFSLSSVERSEASALAAEEGGDSAAASSASSAEADARELERRGMRVSLPAAGARQEVAVLLSGGVDSSVSLRLLQRQGLPVRAFFIKIWLPEYLLMSRHLRRLQERSAGGGGGGGSQSAGEESLGETEGGRGAQGCGWQEDLKFAENVCRQAGVALEVLPLQEAYWDGVVEHMLQEARAGLTPNPDWWCNCRVKFGAFLDLLDSRGGGAPQADPLATRSDREAIAAAGGGVARLSPDLVSSAWAGDGDGLVASGHYARVLHWAGRGAGDEEGGPRRHARLFRGRDPRKDQSYFLSGLAQRQLRRLITPVGDFHKAEVRRLAASLALPTASRRDSQGLCFLGELPLSLFFQHFLGSAPGPVLHFPSCLALGSHAGLWNFTLGQRKNVTPCLDVARVRQLSSPQRPRAPAPTNKAQRGAAAGGVASGAEPHKGERSEPAEEASASGKWQPDEGGGSASEGRARTRASTDLDAGKRDLKQAYAARDSVSAPQGADGELVQCAYTPGSERGASKAANAPFQADAGRVQGDHRGERGRSATGEESAEAEGEAGAGSRLLASPVLSPAGGCHASRVPDKHFARGFLGPASLAGRWVVTGKHPPSNALFVVSEKEMNEALSVAARVHYSLAALAAGAGLAYPERRPEGGSHLLAFLLTLQQKFLLVEDLQWIAGGTPPPSVDSAEAVNAADAGEDADAFLQWAFGGVEATTQRDEVQSHLSVQVRHAGGSACTAIHGAVRLRLLPPAPHPRPCRSLSSATSFSLASSRARRGSGDGAAAESGRAEVGGWHAWIELAEPDHGLAPGQIAAIYQNDECLGAGRISAQQGEIALEAAMKAAGLM